jgi:sigma-E factor negative regulatory protein RseB
VLLLVLCSAGLSSSIAPAPAAAAADPVALRLLERAAAAPARTAYHGVQFVSAWSEQGSTGLVVAVDHRPGHGTSVRTESTAQSPAADTYLPAGAAQPSLVSGGGQLLGLLADNYVVAVGGTRSVAGRSADVVSARRPGAATPAARFWLDRATGLVLRREVYDARGRITRASAFVEVTVGAAGTGAGRTHLPPARPDAWSRSIEGSALPAMRRRGWHCPDRLPGSLQLVDARRGGRGRAAIVHLSYSDGLASVSLFEQRGRLDSERLEGFRPQQLGGRAVYVRDGVPQRVMWSADGTVFTLVADAPADTVRQIVRRLPAPPAEGGGWGRLSRGLGRVASWFNPFA